MLIIDKIAYSSRLRRKSPELKTILAGCSLLLCIWARSFLVSIFVLGVMSCLIIYYGGVALSRYAKLMSAPLAFLILSTITIIFHFSDTPSQLLSLKLGQTYLVVDQASLLYGCSLVVTAFSAVSCMYFLTLTTPILDIIGVLRRIHCPDIIIELMFLIYRFIFVLLEIALAISISQKCRLGNRDFKTAVRAMGLMFAVLLQRALFKSSLLYSSMESRCYDGHICVLSKTYLATTREKMLTVLFLILLAALSVFCKIHGGL